MGVVFLSALEKMSILDVAVVCSWWRVGSPKKLTSRTLDFYGRLPVGFFRVWGDCFLLLFPVIVCAECRKFIRPYADLLISWTYYPIFRL